MTSWMLLISRSVQADGAMQATEYAEYQVVSVPKAAPVPAGDDRRTKDDQGCVVLPNHAIIAQANGGGHVYAIPMAFPGDEGTSNA